MSLHQRPLRVLVFTGSFPALSETFVLDQIVALRDAGMDVSILAYEQRADMVRHAAVDDHRLVTRATYLRNIPGYSRPVDKPVFLGRLTGPVRRRLLLLMGRSIGHRLLRGSKLSRAVNVWRCAAALSAQAKPDIAICHFGPHGDFMAEALSCLGQTCPVVTIFHGYDMSQLPGTLGADMYDALFQSGAWFLPVTEFWRTRLIEMGCPPARTSVFRMGVDVGSIPLRPLRPANEEFVFLSTGRLVEKKGHAFAIRALAAANARSSTPRLRLVIAGDGPLAGQLRQLAKDLDVTGQVTFLGGVTREEVWRRLAAADAFVLASTSASNGDMEGLPVSLMEAMAAGVPVVSTRHSGIPELVEHEVSGLLADERDVEGLAQCMRALAVQPDLGQRLARRGREVVEKHFDLSAWNRRLVEIVNSLTSQGDRSALLDPTLDAELVA